MITALINICENEEGGNIAISSHGAISYYFLKKLGEHTLLRNGQIAVVEYNDSEFKFTKLI